MYRSVLAALLLGMFPLSITPLPEEPPARLEIAIAPPSVSLEVTKSLSASGIVILDMQGGQRIYGKQADVQRPMASLTKLMTALIIIENHDLDEWVTVPQAAEQVEGNKAYLPAGEKFTVASLLSALLIASANDAAYTLAVHHGGTLGAFVEEMNDRARSLGLKNTHYANPSGLDSTEQWSTPQDLAWLASFVMRNPTIRENMGKRGRSIASRNGMTLDLVHTHALLHANTAVVAGKTGTTNGAKECLLSLVEQDGHEYLVVLMHSSQRYADMRALLDILSKKSAVL